MIARVEAAMTRIKTRWVKGRLVPVAVEGDEVTTVPDQDGHTPILIIQLGYRIFYEAPEPHPEDRGDHGDEFCPIRLPDGSLNC